jgi:hypothetical protein
LTAVAAHFGCDPIIFVGMDFCYEKGRKYAEMESEAAKGLIEARGVMTQRDWLMAAEWTEARPERMINATEGGMLRLPTEPLAQVLAKCPKRGDLRRQVHEALQKVPLQKGGRWEEWCGEVVEEKLLEPLWQIWRPIFAREVEVDPRQDLAIHKQLFFERMRGEHG